MIWAAAWCLPVSCPSLLSADPLLGPGLVWESIVKRARTQIKHHGDDDENACFSANLHLGKSWICLAYNLKGQCSSLHNGQLRVLAGPIVDGREKPCVACVAWPGQSGARPISPVSPRLAGCKLSLSKLSWARNVSVGCQGKWLLGDDHILQAT